jgi:hypothetical protein
MELTPLIKLFGSRPIPHHALMSYVKAFKNPNDKIHRLIAEQSLMSVKRGLYYLNPDIVGEKPQRILIANQIYGPSYVSLDYALQHYNAIPERVYAITSVTPKLSKVFENALGRFSYSHIPIAYCMRGMTQEALPGNLYGLIAVPEKALMDKIVTSKGVLLRSVKDASEYLLEDLRIDENWLRTLDMTKMVEYQQNAPKASSINFVLTFIKSI